MSLISTLAFVVAAAAKVFKVESQPPDPEILALKAQLYNLRAQNARLIEKRNSLMGERDRWYALVVQWRERYERRERDPMWVERMEAARQFQEHQQRQAQQAQHQANANLLAQYMQNAQNAQDVRYHDWCNCVPARHDMLMPHHAGLRDAR